MVFEDVKGKELIYPNKLWLKIIGQYNNYTLRNDNSDIGKVSMFGDIGVSSQRWNDW